MNDLIQATKSISEIEISYISIIISLFTTTICSLIIRSIYISYGRSLNNKRNFSNSFILLGITTTIVITVVKFSFALSLGLVGALSIVRFRAAIRDPEELVYLFLIIGIGISSGANQYLVTIFLTIASVIVIFFQEKFHKGKELRTDSLNLIQINCIKKDYEKVYNNLNKLFQSYAQFVNLKSMITEKQSIEISFEFLLSDNTKAKKFMEELNKISSDKTKVSVISNVIIPD
tara:strand:- start:8 stop:703 length:696 start_codon:yes stop_codon:yes gene_type:complete